MPDEFYLEKNAMILSDDMPILGTNETYKNNVSGEGLGIVNEVIVAPIINNRLC